MNLNLKKTTLYLIFGLSLIFVIRTAGTFWPEAFRIALIGKSTQILLFIASCTPLLFFIYFSRDYVKQDQRHLKMATNFAIIGSGAMVFLYLIGLFVIFPRLMNNLYQISQFFFNIIQMPFRHTVGVVFSFISSICILLFFLTFHKEMADTGNKKLKKATLYATLGALASVCFQLFISADYFFFGNAMASTIISRFPFILLMPIRLFIIVTYIYFTVSFYQSLDV